MNREENSSPQLVIVGSGVAGLCAALQGVELGLNPIVLSKDKLGDSNSKLAQGGLSAVTAASISHGDSVAKHVADTLSAGAGHCGVGPVQYMCSASDELVQALESYAVNFDRDEAGTYQLGLEAAHSAHRILHIEGDATGALMVHALVRAVRALEAEHKLRIVEDAVVTDLELQDGKVTGVKYLHHDGEQSLPAHAVLLATGGLGQLYAASTNPQGATADGIGLAARAGAVIADAEFIQFHPTLVDPAQYPTAGMVSEAVRGEGAILVNETGQRFMAEIHPDAELAPRDVVARGIHGQIQAGHRVYLDARAVEESRGSGFLAKRFPSITARLAACAQDGTGLDMAYDLIPVVAAQHYFMGGIYTDTAGRTSVPGLYAAGECANTTVHGANRLASNSLLEAMVFARGAVTAMRGDSPAAGCEVDPLSIQQIDTPNPAAPLGLEQLQTAASAKLGVHRTANDLEEMAQLLAKGAPVAATAREQAELRNLWITARIITAGAIARTESLGAHHRVDAPKNLSGNAGAGIRYGWTLHPSELNNENLLSKEMNA
ncbi:L-aspartate oxidase [Glutamicibacter arilaitensis]|uniref:L-aspartate oxidase n=1 Tax=Glutamicibacter arilaitensis TaxID=256701 RepID=UPI001866B75A|nr:FAD-dependent oxidoreductase [Glutamicibacter arilaitensis]